MEPVTTSPPEIDAVPAAVRGEPPPRHGGPLALLRFLARHRMLTPKYARLLVRLAWLKLRLGRRLQADGLCFVGPGVKLQVKPGARLVLGRWAWIGHGCKIRVHEGVVDAERPIRLQGIYKRDVRVGNNCWIGYGVCVLRGVTVGDNCVLGTSAVVTHDVPADSVAAGIPARVIRRRETPRTLRWD